MGIILHQVAGSTLGLSNLRRTINSRCIHGLRTAEMLNCIRRLTRQGRLVEWPLIYAQLRLFLNSQRGWRSVSYRHFRARVGCPRLKKLFRDERFTRR